MTKVTKYVTFVKIELNLIMTKKVKELIKLIQDDGWYIVAQVGSHRQFKHNTKKGKVTIAGHPNDDIHPKTLKSILTQAGLV